MLPHSIDLVQPLLNAIGSEVTLVDQIFSGGHGLPQGVLVSSDLGLQRLVLRQQQMDRGQVVTNVALRQDLEIRPGKLNIDSYLSHSIV